MMRAFMDGRRGHWLLICCVLTNGCDDRTAVPVTHNEGPTPLATAFNPSSTGTIRGRVLWSGDAPQVPALEVKSLRFSADGAREKWLMPNPNAPIIDALTRGVGNAVVFLREVDPTKSKPWDHAAVVVEQQDRRLRILQGTRTSNCGFVRRADRIDIVSRDPFIHILHADGAAYFSLAFPRPEMSLSRPLSKNGVVELSSAAGFFAMRAYLFVDEHPYYARTDGAGRFVLENVPPGRYDVVGWLPNWLEERRDREPETGIVTRLGFYPPVQSVQAVTVSASRETEVEFLYSAKDFLR